MTKKADQREKDIQSTMHALQLTNPEHATREDAIEMLENMQTAAHLFAHAKVDEERAAKKKKRLSKDR